MCKRTGIERRQLTSVRPARAYATTPREAAESQMASRTLHCVVWNRDNHTLADCHNFAHDSYDRRWYLVNKLRLCYKCLNVGHSKSECQSRNCPQCSRPHHPLLHNQSRPKLENKKDFNVQNKQNIHPINTPVSSTQSKSSK